jgi:hypothetical protein
MRTCIWALMVAGFATTQSDQCQASTLLELMPAPPAKKWAVCEQGGETARQGPRGYSMGWIIYTNKLNGDLLSMRVQRYAGNDGVAYLGGPWTQAPISTFPEGYMRPDRPSERIKVSVAWASVRLMDLGRNVPAVEFTTFWERESGAIKISHGYNFALQGRQFLIQHTSRNVVTPEFAQGMADAILQKNRKPADVKPTGKESDLKRR